MSTEKHLEESTLAGLNKKKLYLVLKDASVTTSKIADQAITIDKLADDTVDKILAKLESGTVSISIDYNGDSLILLGETKTITFRLQTAAGTDLTSKAYAWKIERGSYDEDGNFIQTASDLAWSAGDKATAFNQQSYVSKANISLTWSSDATLNDIDDSKSSTIYRITAKTDKEEIETAINI